MLFLPLSRVLSKKLRIDFTDYVEDIDFDGELYLPNGAGTGGKIFDYTHEKILTYYDDGRVYDKKISTYNYFRDYFSMPKILYTDPVNRIIIEEYIKFKPHNEWDENDYQHVIYDILSTVKKYDSDSGGHSRQLTTPTYMISCITKDNQFSEAIVSGIIEKVKDLQMPILNLHGDLWTSNVLLTKKHSREVLYIG